MQMIIAGVTLAAAGLTPALLGGLGAIASLFGTAGLAAAGFGALATTTIMKTVNTAKELEEAQLKANAALIAGDTKGYKKQMAMIQAIMESLTEEEKKAVVAINALKESWRDLENKMAPTTLRVIASSTDFMRLTMEKLFPAFQGVGESFNKMIEWMNKAITAGKADAFFEHMNTFAVPMFEKVMISAGNILNGFAGIMVSFTPLGMAFGDGMVDMTAKFAKWAWGLQSNPAFQDFCDMVKTNTPIIFGLLGTIVDVIWRIIEKLNPLAMKIFEAANSFLKWSMESGALDMVLQLINTTIGFLVDNANWLVPLLASLWLGFKTLQGVKTLVDIFGKVKEVVELLSGSFMRMITKVGSMVASLGRLSVAMLASPWFWLVAAIAAAIAIGVLIYQNWDTIKKKAYELWNGVKESWSNLTNSVKDSYNNMIKSASDWWNQTKQKWNNMVNDAKSAVSNMKQAVIDKYNTMKSDAVNKLQDMVNGAKQKFNDMVSTARDKASSMLEAGRNLGNNAVNGVKSGLSYLSSSVGNSLSSCYSYIKSWGSSFLSSGKGLMNSFVDGIKSGISKAVNAVSEGMSKVRSYLPFSPAKKGPLSDLDKSGKAFFPTWYNAALTQVKSMERQVGGAFSGVASSASSALSGTGLEAFTGGRTSVTVNHKIDGSVGIDSKGLDDFSDKITNVVVNGSAQTGLGQFGTLNRQSIYKA
ncbi:hypothetical protein [Bacillus cereus group sp. N21]|uniref:hypothetical protein n=1 Tax=Bacillus cereus group sp. N21 TaxID=2794591 RepID=UPI0018F3E62A|nr:hypothetical protein [Bacillus cereus group sp. N21]MBJ8027270.1 hypothetical protein [Bacillus cereus group sp. N21]